MLKWLSSFVEPTLTRNIYDSKTMCNHVDNKKYNNRQLTNKIKDFINNLPVFKNLPPVNTIINEFYLFSMFNSVAFDNATNREYYIWILKIIRANMIDGYNITINTSETENYRYISIESSGKSISLCFYLE